MADTPSRPMVCEMWELYMANLSFLDEKVSENNFPYIQTLNRMKWQFIKATYNLLYYNRLIYFSMS